MMFIPVNWDQLWDEEEIMHDKPVVTGCAPMLQHNSGGYIPMGHSEQDLQPQRRVTLCS